MASLSARVEEWCCQWLVAKFAVLPHLVKSKVRNEKMTRCMIREQQRHLRRVRGRFSLVAARFANARLAWMCMS